MLNFLSLWLLKCLGYVAISLLVTGASFYWMVLSSGDQVPSRVVLDQNAQGFVRVLGSKEDPGIAALLDHLQGLAGKIQQKQLSDTLSEDMQRVVHLSRYLFGVISYAWPRDTTLSVGRGNAGFKAAINLEGMGGVTKLLKMSAVTKEASAKVYREHQVFDGPLRSKCALHGSSFLCTQSFDETTELIDRVLGQYRNVGGEVELEKHAKLLSPSADLVIVHKDVVSFLNTWGLSRLLPSLNYVHWAGIAIDMVSKDRWNATFKVSCADLRNAAEINEYIQPQLKTLTLMARTLGLRINAEPRLENRDIIVEFGIDGVADAIEKKVLASWSNGSPAL
jgi:hypothetical protein